MGSAPPLGIEAATPYTQHPRRDQRGTPHRTPPGHRPPTRRTTPGPLTEQPTHRSRIGRFDTWFRRDSTHWSQLHSPAGGDEFARLILKAYKVVTTTEFSVDEQASTEQKSVPTTPRCLPPGEHRPDLPASPSAIQSPRQPTILRRQVEPPPPRSSYSTKSHTHTHTPCVVSLHRGR